MAVGIIAEYNPFHNGHVYHINKVKEMFPSEEIVLVTSTTFTERGDACLIDKWNKTNIVLDYVDLVVELPTFYATQSADIFAYGAISILNNLKVDKIVFGSECNDISILEKIANVQESEQFNINVKKYLDEGKNYPTALSSSIKDILGFTINESNDLLGISYVKCIKKNNYNIIPYTIKRTNNYYDLSSNNNILSATGIRELIKESKDVTKYVPNSTLKYINNGVFLDDFFKILKYRIISTPDLSIYKMVDEGIDNRIKKYINEASCLDEFVSLIKTKRYTYNRIYRTLTCILCGFLKDKDYKIDYVKVLGFNDKGKKYLNMIKKNMSVSLVTGYNYSSDLLEIEKTVSQIYALGMHDCSCFLKQENSNKPIKK